MQSSLSSTQIAIKKEVEKDELFKTERGEIAPLLYLDPTNDIDLDDYKKLYADLLARWQLFVKSAQINKTLKDKLPFQTELVCTFKKVCKKCRRSLNGGFCRLCNKSNDHCGLCNMKVSGLAWYCISCGHGGHMKHMKTFFKSGNTMCPTGCGCLCVVETTNYLKD